MSPLKHSTNIAARMGRWSASHRKTAIFGWLAFVVAVVRDRHRRRHADDRRERHRTSARPAEADHIIRDGGFKLDEQAEYVLVQSKTHDGRRSRVPRGRRTRPSSQLEGFPQVTKLRSPFAAGNEGQISEDGHSVLIQFSPKGSYDEAVAYIDTIIAAPSTGAEGQPRLLRRRGGLGVDRQGARRDVRLAARAGRADLDPDHARASCCSSSARSSARSIPLAARAHVRVRDDGPRRAPEPDRPDGRDVSEVILLIGLAVGVDYSLFYIRRERDERRAGRSESAALEAAAATSGRAVLISGITVMIAMAGMFFSGDKTFMSFAIGTMMVVAVAMIGSLTVLPAMLSWLGDRVDKVRVPFLWRLQARRRREPRSGARSSIASSGGRSSRPSPPRPCSLGLAFPLCSLHTAISGLDALPKSLKEVQSFNRVTRRLPRRRHAGGRRDQGRRLRSGAPGGGRRSARSRRSHPATASSRSTSRPLPAAQALPRGRSRSSARARTRPRTTRSRRSATRSCRRRSARSPASSTRSPATRRPRRTGTTR